MILDEICAYKREVVEACKQAVPIARLREAAEEARPPADFRRALRGEGISLIAEVKHASPTKGVFMQEWDPVDVAGAYEQGGASAISVLTDEKYFRGSLDDLTVVRKHVAVPCMRKEFIVDEYQIFEARAALADAILLIVRVLSDEQLKDYHQVAKSLGMSCLVETHNAEEIERAIKAGAHIIGINNRDLDTFHTDIHTTLDLKKRVPGGYVLVSESGIRTRDHVKMLEDGGVDAILVGETLVTSRDIVAKIRELLGRDES
jgi:indole-3-glycerol phosphate synthase